MDKTAITINTYNLSAANYEKKFMDLHLYENTLDFFSLLIRPDSNVLDLACGPGNVAKHLLRRKPQLNIIGVDLSEEMIKLARKNVPDADFYIQDIRDLNFASEQFDVIISSFCLPYLYDHEAEEFIDKISKIIANNGYIYLSAMEGEGHNFETASFTEGKQLFINYFSEEFLTGLFEKNNFEIIKLFKQDYRESDGSITIDVIFILRKRSNI